MDDDGAHRVVEIALRELPEGRALWEGSRRFERVGEIDRPVEPRHLGGGGRMFFDRREYVVVAYAEPFPSQGRSKSRVQHDRIGSFESVDRHPPGGALGDQPLRRVEAGKIVEHSGDARLIRVDAVALCEQIRAAGDANAVAVAKILIQVGANAPP